VGGELFVTGRVKDLIVIAGRNYHPYPAEAAAAAVAGVRTGSAAAVGVPDPARGSEMLAIVVESAAAARPQRVPELSAAVAQAVTDEVGLRPGQVVVVRPGTLARTSSGKLQRSRIAADLAAGRLGSAGPGGSAAGPGGDGTDPARQ
jgi:acyl-CoA synthetase (AMP-forming)/AMP-acid ligase II